MAMGKKDGFFLLRKWLYLYRKPCLPLYRCFVNKL
jgi:hypothetical protein